jgi:hypothetical protein
MKKTKNKRYCVTYEQTISHEATIKAKDVLEAARKLLEVIPDAKHVKCWEITQSVWGK